MPSGRVVALRCRSSLPEEPCWHGREGCICAASFPGDDVDAEHEPERVMGSRPLLVVEGSVTARLPTFALVHATAPSWPGAAP